jgi:hypothetical protein
MESGQLTQSGLHAAHLQVIDKPTNGPGSDRKDSDGDISKPLGKMTDELTTNAGAGDPGMMKLLGDINGGAAKTDGAQTVTKVDSAGTQGVSAPLGSQAPPAPSAAAQASAAERVDRINKAPDPVAQGQTEAVDVATKAADMTKKVGANGIALINSGVDAGQVLAEADKINAQVQSDFTAELKAVGDASVNRATEGKSGEEAKQIGDQVRQTVIGAGQQVLQDKIAQVTREIGQATQGTPAAGDGAMALQPYGGEPPSARPAMGKMIDAKLDALEAKLDKVSAQVDKMDAKGDAMRAKAEAFHDKAVAHKGHKSESTKSEGDATKDKADKADKSDYASDRKESKPTAGKSDATSNAKSTSSAGSSPGQQAYDAMERLARSDGKIDNMERAVLNEAAKALGLKPKQDGQTSILDLIKAIIQQMKQSGDTDTLSKLLQEVVGKGSAKLSMNDILDALKAMASDQRFSTEDLNALLKLLPMVDGSGGAAADGSSSLDALALGDASPSRPQTRLFNYYDVFAAPMESMTAFDPSQFDSSAEDDENENVNDSAAA